jgi:hypothetical protein
MRKADVVRTKLKRLPVKFEPGFLRQLDGRTELSQRLTAAYDEIVDDAGGDEAQTRLRRSLIERFVFLEEVMRSWEVQIATKPQETEHLLSRWVQAVNSLQGLARQIGVERKLKGVVNLKNYIEGRTT